eukprot:7567464-Pyramimonas_sp.AAC.1
MDIIGKACAVSIVDDNHRKGCAHDGKQQTRERGPGTSPGQGQVLPGIHAKRIVTEYDPVRQR